MEKLRLDLKSKGHDVGFVVINAVSAMADQQPLIERCSFPLLQDLPLVNAWTFHHQGKKDDMFVYDPAGKLAYYLPIDGPLNTNLSSGEGYQNLRSVILQVAEHAED